MLRSPFKRFNLNSYLEYLWFTQLWIRLIDFSNTPTQQNVTAAFEWNNEATTAPKDFLYRKSLKIRRSEDHDHVKVSLLHLHFAVFLSLWNWTYADHFCKMLLRLWFIPRIRLTAPDEKRLKFLFIQAKDISRRQPIIFI